MATASGNEYEIARAFRIQQNQIKLSALGVREASGAIKPAAAPAKPRFASHLAPWQLVLVGLLLSAPDEITRWKRIWHTSAVIDSLSR